MNKRVVTAWAEAYRLPEPAFEHKFHETRKWLLDIAWPDYKISIEVQGGVWIRGKHGRGSGIIKDYEKLNWAQLDGWIVLQRQPKEVCTFETAVLVKKAIKLREKP